MLVESYLTLNEHTIHIALSHSRAQYPSSLHNVFQSSPVRTNITGWVHDISLSVNRRVLQRRDLGKLSAPHTGLPVRLLLSPAAVTQTLQLSSSRRWRGSLEQVIFQKQRVVVWVRPVKAGLSTQPLNNHPLLCSLALLLLVPWSTLESKRFVCNCVYEQ